MAATIDDVRRIALSLPGAVEAVDGHRHGATWRLTSGVFVWERGPSKTDIAALEKLGRTWPDTAVIGLRTDGLDAKDALLQALPDAVFTIPHFNGYPAVLVRLDAVDPELLEELICDAWLVKAPKREAQAWLESRGLTP